MADIPLLAPPGNGANDNAQMRALNTEAAAYGNDYKAYHALLETLGRFRDRYDELAAPRSLELTACEIKVLLVEGYLDAARKNKHASSEELAAQARMRLAALATSQLRRTDEDTEPLSGRPGFGEQEPADDPDRENETISEREEVLFGKLYRAAARQTHEDAAGSGTGDPAIVIEAQLALQGFSAPVLYRRLAQARRRGNFLETSALSIFIHWTTGAITTLLQQLGLSPADAAELLSRGRASLRTRREHRLHSGVGLLYGSYCTPGGTLAPEWEVRVVSHFKTLIASQEMRLEYLLQRAHDLGPAHLRSVADLLREVSS
jgi:hypothetical protein